MTERLDRIEQGLEQVNDALNVLISEFIRPNAQQTRANYERLERIEADLETTEQQTASNAETATRLEVLIEANATRAAENGDRFNVLIQEMRADRRASQQAFQSLLVQLANINSRVQDLEQAS